MPDVHEVLKVIAEQSGETIPLHGAEAARRLKLSSQVPAIPIFYTSGRSRQIIIGKLAVAPTTQVIENFNLPGQGQSRENIGPRESQGGHMSEWNGNASLSTLKPAGRPRNGEIQAQKNRYQKTGFFNGGEGGIRTRDTGISRIHTFQACSFNHSDTSPHSRAHKMHPYSPDILNRSTRA